MATGDFRDLIVWQRSQELLREVYRLTRQLPPEDVADALALSDEVSRMLRVMRRKLGG